MKIFAIAATFVFAAICTGCSQETIESASADASKNAAIVVKKAKTVEKAARPTANRLQKGARVTAALKASVKVPANIRVDVNDERVRLVGTAKTKAESDAAVRITRDILGDDQPIVNDIKVSP